MFKQNITVILGNSKFIGFNWFLAIKRSMSKSNYEYVRLFETVDSCLPHTWIVVRIDGQNFHKFTNKHNFVKPNDSRALNLAVCAAKRVMKQNNEILLAYGQSDEFSFVFRRYTELFNRRARCV